jgi:ABC-2 type transport system permease protein
MSTYLSYFKIKFLNEIQYRIAAMAGVATQFAWGFMYIMLFSTFISNGNSSMTVSQMSSYIWLQQAFFSLFAYWTIDMDIFNMIIKGDISYELVKPLKLYNIWFFRTLGLKLGRVVLRSVPIILICGLLPLGDYGLMAPASVISFIYFVISLIFSVIMVIVYIMIMYILTISAISPTGIRIVFVLVGDFFAGGLIPIAFMPDFLINILKFTPFYYFQNIPYSIYNGYFSNNLEIFKMIVIQFIWIVVLYSFGNFMMNRSLKKVVIQGG